MTDLGKLIRKLLREEKPVIPDFLRTLAEKSGVNRIQLFIRDFESNVHELEYAEPQVYASFLKKKIESRFNI